jgi:hypothetical protein
MPVSSPEKKLRVDIHSLSPLQNQPIGRTELRFPTLEEAVLDVMLFTRSELAMFYRIGNIIVVEQVEILVKHAN